MYNTIIVVLSHFKVHFYVTKFYWQEGQRISSSNAVQTWNTRMLNATYKMQHVHNKLIIEKDFYHSDLACCTSSGKRWPSNLRTASASAVLWSDNLKHLDRMSPTAGPPTALQINQPPQILRKTHLLDLYTIQFLIFSMFLLLLIRIQNS